MKLREAEAVMSLKEQRQQIRDLEDHWQVCTVCEAGYPYSTLFYTIPVVHTAANLA